MSDLEDGESVEVKGSAAKPYVIKNVGGVYSCSCPAWRNQSIAIETRTCKHLRKLRGDEAEKKRVGADAVAKPVKPAVAKDGPPILLAQAWDNATDLADWWMSEKLDGVRAYWDGKRFVSRQGNEYFAPEWFVEGLPETPLDGELWIDRKKFQRTVSIVRRQDKSDHWREVKYLIFDAPEHGGVFEDRLEFLRDILKPVTFPHAGLHHHERCKGLKHLQEELARVEALEGEGLMLREPGSPYEIGRSATLLKVKTFHDAEATVIDHQAGKGRHKGRLGALMARLADGTEFSIGTGFSDAQRESPPPIGSSVTFRYQELSDAGVPRFPSFVRLHELASGTVSKSRNTSAKPVGGSEVRIEAEKPASSSISASATKRYFELVDGKSSKFWEVVVDGRAVTVRYGRIGNNGTSKVTEYSDAAAAEGQAAKLIGEKTKKGYVES